MVIRGPIAHLRFWREHRFTRGNASSYVEGELAAHERRRVERHAGLCPQCRRFLATLRSMLRALGELDSEPRPGLSEGVIERLRRP
jgi:anti-sigma factor RsiW